jgi:hypothetical protein
MASSSKEDAGSSSKKEEASTNSYFNNKWSRSGTVVKRQGRGAKRLNAEFMAEELEGAPPLKKSGCSISTDLDTDVKVKVQTSKNKGRQQGRAVIAATDIPKATPIATYGPLVEVSGKEEDAHPWKGYGWEFTENAPKVWLPAQGTPETAQFIGLLINAPNPEDKEVENCDIKRLRVERFGRTQIELLVVAKVDINTGDELLLNYGKLYSEELRATRQKQKEVNLDKSVFKPGNNGGRHTCKDCGALYKPKMRLAHWNVCPKRVSPSS